MILSIDPGITTGYALIGEGGNLLMSGNILAEDLGDSVLKYLADKGAHVVIEKIPSPTQSKMNQTLSDILSWLKSTFPDALWVTPGVWKTNLPIANYPIPKRWDSDEFTQHQKDAFRLGVWYMVTRLKETL